MLDGGPVDGFVGFFDVQFKGSPENPATMEVLLSTAPDATGATHWGQQVAGSSVSSPVTLASFT